MKAVQVIGITWSLCSPVGAQVLQQMQYSQDASGALVEDQPLAWSFQNHPWASNPPNGQGSWACAQFEPWLTEWITPFDFPFTLPAAAQIVGIRVEVYAKGHGTLNRAMLITESQIFQPPSGSQERVFPGVVTGSYAWYGLGGPGDLWDIPVTPAQINGGSLIFGVRGELGENRVPIVIDSTRMTVWYTLPCYANCDSSSAAPVLNVADFTCFLQKYAAGDGYANCDESTQAPVLNVADFTCFLTRYAGGCP